MNCGKMPFLDAMKEQNMPTNQPTGYTITFFQQINTEIALMA